VPVVLLAVRATMATRTANSTFGVLLAVFFVLVSSLVGADKPDFSGSYTLTSTKGAAKVNKGPSSALLVVQNESAIEITKVIDGRKNVNKFPLDGTEGIYESTGGAKGKCKGRFKGKSLVLDMFVTTHPQPNAPDVQIHMRERWEMSSDSKKLTIRSDVDSTVQPYLKGFQITGPLSEIYTRN